MPAFIQSLRCFDVTGARFTTLPGVVVLYVTNESPIFLTHSNSERTNLTGIEILLKVALVFKSLSHIF